MSDKKVVHESVKYWVCACRFFVHTDGFADGFWFLNQHLAVSTQLLWDLLNLQMQGCGVDFSFYCRTCNPDAKSAMRDKRNMFINRNQLSDLYFAFYSRLSIVFNQGCYGCIADAKGFPSSFVYSNIQQWSKNAPPIARDIATVGMDGLSSFFAKYIVFKKKEATVKEKEKDSTHEKSTAHRVRRKHAPLQKMQQNDRCPIRTGGWELGTLNYVTAAAASQDVRQCAMKLRKDFFALGVSIQGSTAKSNWFYSLEVLYPIQKKYK